MNLLPLPLPYKRSAAPHSTILIHTTGGVFQLELFLPDDYPMCPPRIRFLTRIYHPNIDRLGRICLDVLKNNWSPALQIRTILLSIQALLGAPNPEDPLNEAVAKQWKVSDKIRDLRGELWEGKW